MKKRLCILLALLMMLSALAACTGGGDGDASPSGGGDESPSPAGPGDPGDIETDEGWGDTVYDEYTPPPADTAMELDIMMWSGSNTYLTDIGSQNWTPEDIIGQNDAAAYAVAKAFNKLYPNVKVNIWAKSGGPDDAGVPWAQEIENFRAEHGKYPDFFCTTDMANDIKKGLLADISVFENDPMYRSFNKGVMDMMKFEGRYFALPQYLVPWGVYVNKTLADNNNIDVPEPDWTLEEYTRFVMNSSPTGEWFGAMDADRGILTTASKGFTYNLVNRQEGDPFVNLATEEFYKLLEYIPRWCNHAAYPQNDLGNVPDGWGDFGWPFPNFRDGKLLSYAGDPWMMGDLAHPNPDHWGRAVMADWDIYPRPSSAELGNTVGVVLDPFAIFNFPALAAAGQMSEEEAQLKLQMCWEFAKFWCADTRSWQARADQMWNDGGTLKTAMNDSLPLRVGSGFAEQMEIWYTAETHQRFADKAKMPGFHYVLDVWERGDLWDVSDKAYPWKYEYEGSTRDILFEYFNSWDVNIVGATRTDANWLDNVKARMPDWNRDFNARWETLFAEINEAINRYYR